MLQKKSIIDLTLRNNNTRFELFYAIEKIIDNSKLFYLCIMKNIFTTMIY